MKGIMRKLIYLGATAALTMSASIAGAVPVHINSGNPAYPFPQFLEYAYGDSHRLGNLGTRNAEGVVHAEMEQEIRDAYQVHANEFQYADTSLQGIKYIYTPYKAAYDCTEGDGYALLAAAYMGDAITFNGYWLCTHDKRRSRTKKYFKCEDNAPGYQYGPYAIGDRGAGGNTAADGDVDVALALYVAYKQWGEFMKDADGNIVNDACGNPISYKEAMIEVIRGLVALSTRFEDDLNNGNILRVNSGLIGLDGYPKGGDTWNDQTGFVNQSNPIEFTESKEIFNLTKSGELKTMDAKGLKLYPEFQGPRTQHVDYNAPAYFREFYELFEELGGDPWEIEQFRRGEASSDWLIGDLISKSEYSVPTAGWVSVFEAGENVKYWKYSYDENGKKDSVLVDKIATEAGTEFSNFDQGEDYRCSWRTICNYMWHGNPDYHWDPTTHTVVPGKMTYEEDAAIRFSKWMNDPSNWNPAQGSHCIDYGSIHNMPYGGPATIRWQNDPNTGVPSGVGPGQTKFGGQDFYCSLSMQSGTGSYAAVGAKDYELMGLLYRECAIKWDTKGSVTDISYPESEKNNVGMRSNYMHGWARQMGMMVLSGNYPAPSQMVPKPNLKIYRAIKDSVTFCFTGDTITYLLDYRNYGSVDAEKVVIVENVPEDFIVVPGSISNGGVLSGGKITWTLGKLAGYHSDGTESGYLLDTTKANVKATMGQVSYRLIAGPKASGRYCTTAEITCSNGLGWVSNEYPNYKTATMQRNCVDVLKRSLMIEKKADREKVNPGQTAVYSIDFENSSEAGWIDGGRPRVNVSWAMNPNGNAKNWCVRLFHDAIEPLINYANYRVSYYSYDPTVAELCDSPNYTCSDLTKWTVTGNAGFFSNIIASHEIMMEKSDKNGKWNQRVSIQFPFVLATTATYISWNTGNVAIHKGDNQPMKVVKQVTAGYSSTTDWTDDWSYGDYEDPDNEALYYPISPARQRLDEKGEAIVEPINKWVTCGCTESPKVVENVLVEEYDGYVWRRILGDGPVAGRDIDSVYVRDTLPKGLEFAGFVGECPLEEFGATAKTYKTASGKEVVEWFIPKMQAGHKGTLKYKVIATFPSGKECETDDELIINNAWISGVKNSPVSDTAKIIVTCGLAPEPMEPTTMTKVADKMSYEDGDEIVYTIGYKQTHGAIFEDAAQEVDQWNLNKTASGEWSTKISNGTISLVNGSSAEHKKSTSVNCFISMDCVGPIDDDPANSQWSIKLRDDLEISFWHQYTPGGQFTYSISEGNTELESITFSQSQNNNKYKIAIELRDDVLKVWFNKDTTKMPVVVSNVTVKPGALRIIGPGNNTVTLSNIHIHTDYAYDISIVDIVPAQVIVDETSFESYHNGVAAGTGKYYKTAAGDSIVWTGLADNPIAWGDTFTVVWKGTVDGCNDSIFNYAKTKLFGYEHNKIMARAISKCIDGDCAGAEKATIKFKDDKKVICAGDSTVLIAGATPANSKYVYQFYLDGEPIGTASRVDTFVAKKPGVYKVDVTDPDCPNASAPMSPKITLTVNALPDEVVPEKSICENESLPIGDVTIDDYTIEWYKDAHTLFAVDVAEIPAEDVVETYFYVLTDANGCKSEPKPWNVEIKELPSKPIVAEKEIEAPLTEGGSKNITDKVTPSKAGNKIVWYESDGITEKEAPIRVKLDNVGPQTYFVRQIQDGCLGDSLSITVIVTDSQKPNPSDTTVCVGEEVEVASLVKKEEGTDLIWYDENGDETTDPGTYSSTEAATKPFTVAQKKGEAVSEKITFTITTVDVAKLKEDVEINYCAGEPAAELKAEIDASACTNCQTPTGYQWYLGESRTNDLNPNTDVTERTVTYFYHVEPKYQIPNGKECVGKKVDVNVVVNFVPALTTQPVRYVLSDAVNDKFPSLEYQNSSVAKPLSGDYSVEWYTEDGDLIGTTAPSPTMADVDLSKPLTTLTYKVKQVKNDCRSEFSTVTVYISKIPTPEVKNAYYCDGETPDPLSSYVKATNGYTLVWYDGDPEKGGVESGEPVINTTADPGEETIKKYYVAQRNADGTSGAVFVEAHIFAKPTIITHDTASCEEPVNVNTLWLPKTTRVEFYTAFGEYFRDPIVSETKKGLQLEGVISISVDGVEKTCRSDRSKIKVEIHKLDFDVVGPSAVCPNSEVTLNVNMIEKEIEDSTLKYSWKGSTITTENFVSDPITQETKFTATVTDGVCKKTKDKTVKITNGKIDGFILISEDGKAETEKEIATAEGVKYTSCGGDVTIVADVDGFDFMWDNTISGNTITKNSGVYNLKYKNKDSEGNECETGFKVEIVSTPIVDNTVPFDSTLCEDETVTLKTDITAGTETPKIVWKKDGVEVGTDASLVLKKVKSSDAAEYSYEASYNGCKSENTKFGTIKVLPRPKYTLKPVEPVCAGKSIEIGVETTDAVNVEWEANPTLVATGYTAVVTPEHNETYSLTVSKEGKCKISEDIDVKVSKPIDFSINGNDTTVCENSIGNLKFGLRIVEGDVLSYEWRNVDKDSVVSSSSVLKFNETEIGTYRYKVELTSEACGSEYDDIEITVAGTPLIDTVVKIDYHHVEIVPNTAYGESPFEFKIDANEFSTSVEYYASYGHHKAFIKDNNGCKSEYLFETEAPDFEIPTVITPNGDGQNDAFMSQVISEAYPDARVTIYDRYGKKLTEIKGDESWDGMYNGHKMPSTDYWYEIWIEEIRKKYVGHFTLINE